MNDWVKALVARMVRVAVCEERGMAYQGNHRVIDQRVVTLRQRRALAWVAIIVGGVPVGLVVLAGVLQGLMLLLGLR